MTRSPENPNSSADTDRSSLRGVTLLGVAVLGVALGATVMLWAQKKSAAKWNESHAGSVPTEYGELISITGDAQSTFLAFQNSKKEIRIVIMRGNKLPKTATIIGRDESADAAKSWKQTAAGAIPGEFGELVRVDGDAQATFLAFRNDENELRTVLLRGARLPNTTTVIGREY